MSPNGPLQHDGERQHVRKGAHTRYLAILSVHLGEDSAGQDSTPCLRLRYFVSSLRNAEMILYCSSETSMLFPFGVLIRRMGPSGIGIRLLQSFSYQQPAAHTSIFLSSIPLGPQNLANEELVRLEKLFDDGCRKIDATLWPAVKRLNKRLSAGCR